MTGPGGSAAIQSLLNWCYCPRIEPMPPFPVRGGSMTARRISFYVSAVAAAALLHIQGPAAQNAVALSGIVSSAQEGAMEGVLVTARKDGASIATTVGTDEKGRYSFPGN